LSHTTVDGGSHSHCCSKETHRRVVVAVGDQIVLRCRTLASHTNVTHPCYKWESFKLSINENGGKQKWKQMNMEANKNGSKCKIEANKEHIFGGFDVVVPLVQRKWEKTLSRTKMEALKKRIWNKKCNVYVWPHTIKCKFTFGLTETNVNLCLIAHI